MALSKGLAVGNLIVGFMLLWKGVYMMAGVDFGVCILLSLTVINGSKMRYEPKQIAEG